MAKVALLIGVSEYEPGLTPLPAAIRDIEAMRRVLGSPKLGGFDQVKPLLNPNPMEMQIEIQAAFSSSRNKDDLVLLFFSGHGVRDERGKLYLASRLTHKTERGELVKGTAVAASFIHDIMNDCRSKRQVLILDCCFSGAFAEGLLAKEDGSVDVRNQLGGEGRAVLTSSAFTEYSFEQKGEELSIYTRYLVEGIETGVADRDRDGMVSVDELHEYAREKVQEAVPTMKPEMYILEEGDKIRLAQASIDMVSPGLALKDVLSAPMLVKPTSANEVLPNPRNRRTLATIMFTDGVGFSARMAEDEEHTLELIRRDLQLMRQLCQQFEGYVIKCTGDGLLMCFASALGGVNCAIEIQKLLAEAAASLQPYDILSHRIGIHLGDVFVKDDDVMGNGVNLAARLESKAQPGGICISQTVYDLVKNHLNLPVIFLGNLELKNIPEPVPSYLIQVAPQSQSIVTPNLKHRAIAASPISPQDYRDRQTLLDKVNNAWIKGVLEKSLHGQALIVLGLEERLNTVDSPAALAWETPDQPQQTLAPGTKAIDQFDQLGTDRTLLILGEPGSGKTITLLELARDLINRANQDVNLPMPIVLNLSSWKGGRQTMDNWLVQELNRQYQVPKQTGSKWVKDGQLLLLLDGLDEVREDIRSACVQVLNQFRQEHGHAEMIVASRIKDYEALKHRLRFSGAIYVQPLTEAQIQHYLANASAKLAAVSTALQTDTQLQELAKSPLMLNIITLAYQGLTLEALPSMNLEERRQHLFNAYIERMFSRRGADQRYPKQQAMHWLIWLAKRMVQKSQTVFLIESMQPSWLLCETHKQNYRIGVRLIVGLLSGLYVGLLSGILNYDPRNSQLVFELLPELISGLASGLVAGLLSGLDAGVIVGLISALIFGLISLMIVPQKPQPVNVVIFGIIFGIIFQRLNRQEIEPVDTVKWSWLEAKKKWIIGMIGGVVSGIILLISGLIIVFYGLDKISNSWLNNFLKLAIVPNLYQVNSPHINIQTISVNISNIGLGLLTLGLFVGVNIGLILGFKKEPEVERKTLPNQGIWRSALNAAKLFAISGAIGGLISELIWWIYHQHPEVIWWVYYGNHPRDGLIFGLTVGLMVGLLSSLVGGDNSGLVSIQHLILRVILWKSNYTPWNYARFLDYATTRIFLQKVGGGYIFIHRLLLEHFALMPQPNNKSSDE